MRRILLLMTTATYRARAFMRAAENLGLAVTVGSERPQILSDANPAGHLVLDFGSIGEASRLVDAHHRVSRIGAVVAADDDGVILAAFLSARLGLPFSPVAAVTAARDKHRMREILAERGIPSPWFTRVAIDEDPAAAAARLRYPCVVKPPALSASRGVIRADDPAGCEEALRRAAAILRSAARAGDPPARHLLVEGYIPGREVALEGILTNGRLRTLALFDKPDPLVGPAFEESIYVTPSRLPRDMQLAVESMTQRVAAALGLTHGPVHAELRLDEGEPVILEIAPRSIGGLCSRTLLFGPGRLLEELILCHALGEDVSGWPRDERAAGVMMIPIPRAGTLKGVHGRQEALAVAGIEDVLITIPVGGEVLPPPEGSRYLGFLFARSDGPGRVEASLRAAHGYLAFDIV